MSEKQTNKAYYNKSFLRDDGIVEQTIIQLEDKKTTAKELLKIIKKEMRGGKE